MKTRLIAGFFLTAVLIIEAGFVFANPGKRTYVGTYREEQDIACTVNEDLPDNETEEEYSQIAEEQYEEEKEQADSEEKTPISLEKPSSMTLQPISKNKQACRARVKQIYSQPEYKYEMEKLREDRFERGVINKNIPLALENKLLKIRNMADYRQ